MDISEQMEVCLNQELFEDGMPEVMEQEDVAEQIVFQDV